MKKKLLGILVLCIACSFAFAQSEKAVKFSANNTWSKLAKVSYEVSEDEFGVINLPVFSEEVKQMEGEEVVVPGYIIPAGGLDAVFSPNHFILSSLPLAACFFCGVGGAETVVEVYLEDPIDYTDAPIQIKGKLVLNAHDIYQLMYILEDAEVVEEVN